MKPLYSASAYLLIKLKTQLLLKSLVKGIIEKQI